MSHDLPVVPEGIGDAPSRTNQERVAQPHTPGPWSAQPSSADFWYVVVGDDNYGPAVASTWSGDGHFDQESNARLLAAAPDLLEALLGVVAVLDNPHFRRLWAANPSLETYAGPRLSVEPLRAAIARAEGRS